MVEDVFRCCFQVLSEIGLIGKGSFLSIFWTWINVLCDLGAFLSSSPSSRRIARQAWNCSKISACSVPRIAFFPATTPSLPCFHAPTHVAFVPRTSHEGLVSGSVSQSEAGPGRISGLIDWKASQWCVGGRESGGWDGHWDGVS